MSKVNDASLVQENGAMQLLEEIIELAVDDNGSLSALLRKCLVLSFRLKNERLRMWADKELDGYAGMMPCLTIGKRTPTPRATFGARWVASSKITLFQLLCLTRSIGSWSRRRFSVERD